MSMQQLVNDFTLPTMNGDQKALVEKLINECIKYDAEKNCYYYFQSDDIGYVYLRSDMTQEQLDDYKEKIHKHIFEQCI